MEIEEPFPGVFKIEVDAKEVLATRNLTPGLTVYGEQLISVGGEEYRSWNPYRSKLAAAVLKGVGWFHLSRGDKVLYLGVASGTTCSHVSDIIGHDGHVWGVDFSSRPIRDLIDNLAKYRANISPILDDARSPESYSALVPRVDVLYSDVAQPDQADIVIKNAELYLRPGGWAYMVVKSRSVDATRPPKSVYEEQIDILEIGGFTVEEVLELDPYQKDHAMVIARFQA